ncbi:hypothetical protein [Aliarcobacter skirrowii]|uniref:hypothetical protein n=1 Tax=Aliarcobacter skirrowii TaxID=28200 RepID=UPI0038502904
MSLYFNYFDRIFSKNFRGFSINTTSIISLDLGGKNTGFFSCTTNDFNNLKNFQSGTIIYDESFILSQVNRRGKRHTKRNNLRRKLAKRLFLLVLNSQMKSKKVYLLTY